VAKAKTVAPRPRGAVPPPRAERGNYFVEVVQELRKVSWPTRPELIRMTQIVLTTVVIFALLIGAADLLLSIVVKQLYVQPGSTTLGNFQQK
jgi:preprotein translocase subunit SecE